MKEDSKIEIIKHLENLKSEDFKTRKESVSNLHSIAQFMGVQKTRNLLLPFLKEFKDDEKEIMLLLAHQLKLLGDFICKDSIHLAEIIPYFYLCLNYEDLKVIDKAIESLKYLAQKYKFKHESIIALSKKLIQTKYLKSVVSSVRLSCELAEYIPSKYSGELIKVLEDSADSKKIIIRKQVAYSMRFILKEKSPFINLSIKLLKKLVQDKSDTV